MNSRRPRARDIYMRLATTSYPLRHFPFFSPLFLRCVTIPFQYLFNFPPFFPIEKHWRRLSMKAPLNHVLKRYRDTPQKNGRKLKRWSKGAFTRVPYECVMSHRNEEYHTYMSHITIHFLIWGAKEPYKREYILQKRPIILRSLLIVANP